MAVGRVDAGDAVGVPDVGVDLTFHEFEFVQIADRRHAFADSDLADLVEGVGAAEAEDGRAVRGDDLSCGAGHAPALAGVGEAADGRERDPVEDGAGVRLPGPFEQVVAVGRVDDALAKEAGGEIVVVQEPAFGGIDEDL